MSSERRFRSGRGFSSRGSSSRQVLAPKHPRAESRSRRESGAASRSSKKKDSRYAEPLFKKSSFRSSYTLPADQLHEEDEAIRSYKGGEKPLCPRCALPIADVGSALMSREDGSPMHFDCALAALSEKEKIADNERLTYIGQGRFGVLQFANIHDMRHFTIKKIIEWEDKDSRPAWRDELAGLYSRVR
ncbi:MAG: hypothetical protein IJU95_09325 [Treponema sp.]|nr:hypothetical protein [Treponema sp.]